MMTSSTGLLINFIFNLPAFLIAIVVHEYAHGFIAYRLGDNTAKHMGRLTFNPLAHIDLFGTIIFPLLLIGIKAPFVFGWAKPIPVNFYNLHHPKKDMIWVGLAGPAANFITAFIAFLILKLRIINQTEFVNFLLMVFFINLVLGIFNLIPMPPLDGSRILMGILPQKLAIMYSRFEPYGKLIIILLLFFIWRFL